MAIGSHVLTYLLPSHYWDFYACCLLVRAENVVAPPGLIPPAVWKLSVGQTNLPGPGKAHQLWEVRSESSPFCSFSPEKNEA